MNKKLIFILFACLLFSSFQQVHSSNYLLNKIVKHPYVSSAVAIVAVASLYIHVSKFCLHPLIQCNVFMHKHLDGTKCDKLLNKYRPCRETFLHWCAKEDERDYE